MRALLFLSALALSEATFYRIGEFSGERCCAARIAAAK